MYILRLDDASEHMNIDNWLRMEELLDKLNIKPIFGIIPNNQDTELLRYNEVADFWELMKKWKNKGWTPALHGYNHLFETNVGGINPVNLKSEFAGLPLEKQKQKIRDGYRTLVENGINADIFFAPAHTFDEKTLRALKEESSIRIVSDTIATDVYFEDGIYFIPQQSGRCRRLPFSIVTFCYHPNIMNDDDFEKLEDFLTRYKSKFISSFHTVLKERKFGFRDRIVRKLYFARRKA